MAKRKKPDEKQRLTPSWYPFALLLAILVFAYMVFMHAPPPSEPTYTVSYSEFKTLIKNGQVKDVTLQETKVTGTLFDPLAIGPQGEKSTRFSTQIPAIGDDTLLPSLDAAGIKITAKEAKKTGTIESRSVNVQLPCFTATQRNRSAV